MPQTIAWTCKAAELLLLVSYSPLAHAARGTKSCERDSKTGIAEGRAKRDL